MSYCVYRIAQYASRTTKLVNRISMLDIRYSSLVSSFIFCEHQVSRIEYPELKLVSPVCDSPFTIHDSRSSKASSENMLL